MSPSISLMPSSNPTYRNATRLLSMLHELHKAGYQHLRCSSGMSPSGLHWRCSVTHVGNMTSGGLWIRHDTGVEVAHYSTGAGDRYFDWTDAPGKSARRLAVLLLERFRSIAQHGFGRDWAYAGWLTEVLGKAERDESSGLPVFFADHPLHLKTGRSFASLYRCLRKEGFSVNAPELP